MTGESKRLVDVPSVNSILYSDSLFVTSGGTINQAAPNTIFSNVVVQVSSMVFGNTYSPSNSSINVSQGTIWFDNNYIYVAVANNVLKRASLSSF